MELTAIQRQRLNKLASNHPVRVREFNENFIVVVTLPHPKKHEFSVYTILPNGLSVDFIWFKSKEYTETFKALLTLKKFERSLA